MSKITGWFDPNFISLEYCKLIDALASELDSFDLVQCMHYTNKQNQFAWDRALIRFDVALSKAIESKNWALAKSEAEIYFASCLNYVKKYKDENTKCTDDTVLRSILELTQCS